MRMVGLWKATKVSALSCCCVTNIIWPILSNRKTRRFQVAWIRHLGGGNTKEFYKFSSQLLLIWVTPIKVLCVPTLWQGQEFGFLKEKLWNTFNSSKSKSKEISLWFRCTLGLKALAQYSVRSPTWGTTNQRQILLFLHEQNKSKAHTLFSQETNSTSTWNVKIERQRVQDHKNAALNEQPSLLPTKVKALRQSH